MARIAFLLLFVLSSVVIAKIPLRQLINSPTVSPKVYKDAYRYMVSIRNRQGQYLCGGALISQNYVLTAAHCFGLYPFARRFTVYFNSSVLSKQVEAKIEDVKIHPDYRHAHNDLALIQLKNTTKQAITPVEISSLNVGKLPINVLGWGSTSASPLVLSNELRIFNGESITHDDCSKEFHDVDREEHLCFSGGNGATSATCRGDSGSPILNDGKLVAVLSIGNQNCTVGKTEVAVRLSPKYIKWIEDNTK